MKKRIILVGKSAAGKDHARKICEQWFGLPYQVSYTTRPPRDEETDGFDYFFVSESEFKDMIKKDLWFEYVVFNGWYYGTTCDQFDTLNSVFIMTPAVLSHLSEGDRADSLVIYFDIPLEYRQNRMYERDGNADSVERRIAADEDDFKFYENYDISITNPFYRIGELYTMISEWMDLPDANEILLQNVGKN
jgi:guanylate kinase